MFSFGLSSVLGHRDNSTKKTPSLIRDDNWYLPYNGPYEAPPRDTSPQRRKLRDSWGDPIPTNNLAVSGNEEKIYPNHQYEPREIKYGVQGVFDDEWKRVGTSGFGVASDRERGRCGSYGHDQRPSFGPSEPSKNAFPTTSRRRSTISSGNSPTVPDYLPLDGVCGGVGESPVPQRRASHKDVNRISFGSIFTFGARMRTGSPTRSTEDGRGDIVDFRPARPKSDPEKERVSKSLSHATFTERHSTSNNRVEKRKHGLSNLKEDYHGYNSFYSTLVADHDDGTPENHHKRSRERRHRPGPTAQVEKPGQSIQLLRVGSRQTSTLASVGHPYAPYAHQNQDLRDRSSENERPHFPTLDDSSLQRHPFNQVQPAYTGHPYGQSVILPVASSPSHITDPRTRGPGQSEGHGELHGELQQILLQTNTIAVASGIGATNTVVGLGAELDGRKLKMSRSVPNFHPAPSHDCAAGPSNAIHPAPPMPSVRAKHLIPPKAKERWLSAETWCDALLFPRPRLKVKNVALYNQGDESFIGGPPSSGSGRIVSPPPSPLGGNWDVEIHREEIQLQTRLRDQHGGGSSDGKAMQTRREPGIPSRVLAHSRSFDLSMRPGQEETRQMSNLESRATRRRKAQAVPVGRDRSDTQDILPPPVPDLIEVLSEGRLLDEERQTWQALAVNSFGNKRSRSLSRTRSKSLSRKGRSSIRRKGRDTGADELNDQGEEQGQSSFEYLAAQAYLGNQTVSVTCGVSSPDSDETRASADISGLSRTDLTGDGNGTRSDRVMHLHSNSHSTAKTVTKSSKSKSHSRNNSVGNSAVHAGRITVNRLCGNLGLDVELDHVERLNLVDSAASVPHCTNIRMAPDLEGALKTHGTKVIRLADPAHIPVDKGLPVPEPDSPYPLIAQSRKKTTSPDLSVSDSSVISHSKVGIAIGTPPEVEGAGPTVIPVGPLPVSESYVPSHPYAQGGLSFSVRAAKSGRGPNDLHEFPEASTPLQYETSTKHKIVPHPYALTLGNTAQGQSGSSFSRLGITVPRDSYLDANGLFGQFRSSDNKPDPSRMWAQLSPDVVREILADDLQYSPYNSDLKGIDKLEGQRNFDYSIEGESTRAIQDTSWMAEALLSTKRYGKDNHVMGGEDKTGKQMGSSEKMQPSRTVSLNNLRKPSHSSSAHTIASSHLDLATKSPSTRLEFLDRLETASPTPNSGTPSPPFRPLGSPNDLDSFQDLFYQPSMTDVEHPPSPDATANVESWDAVVRNRRTGSSLTSLARQLSEEYEALASVNASRTSSLYLHSRSRSLGALPHHAHASGFSSEGNLQFVFEEMPFPDRMPNVHETVHAFESANLPEDVYSLQASSITDGNGADDNARGLLRLGTVESVTTPIAVDVEQRISFNGETIFDYEDRDTSASQPTAPLGPSQVVECSTNSERPDNAISRRDMLPVGLALQRPLTQVTRSSCMTTSDLSRMSGLSDFPVPPKSIYSEQAELSIPTSMPHYTSVFEAYNNERGAPQTNASFLGAENVERPRNETSSSSVMSGDVVPQGVGVEFGVNQSAVELARSLSSM